jgi:hypothetical protein
MNDCLDLSASLELLSSIIRDRYSFSSAPPLGSFVKPELARRSNARFNEQLLGFRKFSEFLREAERLGYVRLNQRPGLDWEIFPGQDGGPALSNPGPVLPRPATGPIWSAETRPVTVNTTPFVIIRQDLWNAFNSLAPDWVYDRVRDVACKRNHASNQQDVIEIPPGRERLAEWIRSFANMQDAGTKARLIATVNGGPAELTDFNNFVRSSPQLLRAWRRFHVQQVLSAIEAWATMNNIQPKDLVRQTNTRVAQSPSPASVPASQVPGSQTQSLPAAAVGEPQGVTAQRLSPTLGLKLEPLIDDLIDSLIKLRGMLQILGIKTSRE